MNLRDVFDTITASEIIALRWLPADCSTRNRSSSARKDSPSKAILERLADLNFGDPRKEVTIRACLCERVPELDAPKEFDEH